MSYMLRELSRNDLPEVTKWRNDPSLIQWLGSAFRYIDSEVDSQWFEKYLAGRANNVRLAICEEKSKKIVGAVYLLGIDWLNRSCEFSILIGSDASRGKGIGEFATRGALRHAFADLNLRRINLTVLASNERALRLYTKVGFVQEGRARQAVYKNGTYIDLVQMAILTEEYQQIHPNAECSLVD
jgi:UDP-4-amino-4,6-dideoxy-N-acetyl-beta-L-altrosamine N-acetyltransferase